MEANRYRATIFKYIAGFILSLATTFAAYILAVHGELDGVKLTVLLGVLALGQMLVQLVFFLHINDEVGPRWKLLSFVFMAHILFIVVAGSLWIMHHLNYNMMRMTPEQKNEQMNHERDKGY